MKLILALSVSLLAAGCSQNNWLASDDESPTANKNNASINQVSIHDHVTRLGNNLFKTAHNINLKHGVAVGTFVPINKISGKSLPSDNYFGHQIQESFVTVGTQAGLKVIEFKTSPAIKFQDNYDIMLSRNVKEVDSTVDANYFLTGTYTEQEESYIVNVRIIDLKTKAVVAAATDYIPLDVLFKGQKTTMKHDMLYRKGY